MANPDIRRHFVRLVVSVVVIDAVALAAYYGLHVARMPTRTQTIFAGVWMVMTLVVVLVGLTRLREARRRALRG